MTQSGHHPQKLRKIYRSISSLRAVTSCGSGGNLVFIVIRDETGSPVPLLWGSAGKTAMHFSEKQFWDFVGRVYDNVHAALWASLLAFVVWFVVVVAPKIPDANKKWEITQLQEIAAEHEAYCRKWGVGLGENKHDQCILDLQAFRAGVERRIREDSDF
jgi:hypothetical protein